MSFAYKILNPSDITISPYTANKLYTFASSSLTEYGIVVYSGEYEPIINVSCSDGIAEGQVPCNPYNPENDITSNGYARRLIYDSIQKLYYQSFISGGFSNVLWTSSSYENYLQTALTSGSNYLTNIRVFGQDSGSGGSPYGGGIYESGSYPSDPSLIRVISIPQDIFGSGIKPGTFEISSSNYLIQDDGQGNLMDNKAISSSLYEGTPYVANVYGGTTDRQGIHVGNIIYSHGMVIITNEDYFCFYPSEPVAQNNTFSILNVQPTKLLPVLNNDFDDCAELNTGSLSVVTPLAGYNFPNNGPLNGYVNINASASNHHQVTPGLYKGTYYVSNSLGIPSNYATVSLEIYSSPLQLNVLSYTVGCDNTFTSQSVTYSINYGVPPYSWSLNETTSWDGISNLYQPTQSLSVAPVVNTLYIKDAVGEIVSQSIVSVGADIIVNYTTSSILCYGGTGSITVLTASSDFPVSVSIDNTNWITSFPHTFTGLTAAEYFIYAENTVGCFIDTPDSVPLDDPNPITASLTVLQGDCTDPSVGNVGAISSSVNGGVPSYSYTWYFNGSPLVPNQNTPLPVGLQTGSYYVVVSDTSGGCNDGTSNTLVVGTSNPISFTATPTNVGCYGSSTGEINLTFNGGSGSVTGSIYNGSTLLTSTSIIPGGPNGDITATGLPSGSNYSIRLVDARGCTISQSVTINSPERFEVDLNATGALYIYKPSLYDPYTAQFSLHGGNYSTYHVTLSAILPGNLSYIDVASGSFVGNSGTSSFTIPVSGTCLYDSSSWILKATDALGCNLANSSSQATYVLPTQVVTSLVQYVPTGSTPPFNVPTSSCTASAVNLYFTASETSIGWSDMAIGDHVWENCNLTISASGHGYWDFESIPIVDGVYNPDDIHFLCTTPPIVPPNRLYAQIVNTQQGSSQVTGLYSALSYNISTNSIITASLASYTSYGNSNYYDYIQWTGSNTELWVDANLNTNTSSFFAINSDVVMSVEPIVTLYYDFKSSGSTPSQIVSKNQSLFSINYGCLTYQDSYLRNLYDLYQLPLPVSLDPLYDYVLEVEYFITNAPNVCY